MPPPIGTFAIAGPASITVKQGQSVSVPISLTATSRWQKFTTYSVYGLPFGIQATFDPYGCKPTCATVLSLACSSNVPLGSYAVTVKATTNRWSSNMSMFVNVAQMEPTQPPVPPGGEPFTADVWVAKEADGGSDSNDGLAEFVGGGHGPKLTIAAGLGVIGTSAGAGANKVVAVKGGTYDESLEGILPSGSSWAAPFTLQSKPGATVVIRGTNDFCLDVGSSSAYGQNQAFFSIISGFKFDGINLNFEKGCMSFGASTGTGPSDIRILDSEFYSFQSVAIFLSTKAHDFLIDNNEMHDNKPHTPQADWGYAVYTEGHDIIFSHNHVYNLDAYALHNYSGFGTNNDNIFDGNIIHDVCAVNGDGIIMATGDGGIAKNNVIYNTGSRPGISVALDATNIKVYHNTVYNCNIGIQTFNTGGTNLVRNNIATNNGTNFNIDSLDVDENNTTSASFVNAAGGNFHLSADDNGGQNLQTDVPVDKDGVTRPTTPDRGAYEFVS